MKSKGFSQAVNQAMENDEIHRKLDRISFLLTANLFVMAICGVGLVAGLLPKLGRLTEATERVEKRFQSFADDVQPVVSAGAGKVVDSIRQIDSERLSNTATESTDELIKAAGEKAKRYLEKKNKQD
jgi:hypothetical protein